MKINDPGSDARVRPAERADVPRMLELVRELAAFERAPDEVTVTLEEFTAAGFGPHPVYQAWVVEEDREIPAFALCYTRYSTWKGSRLYLEDLFVTENKRNRGLGRLLFEACMDEVLKRGLSGMVWQVLDWNTSAIKFYERYGCQLDTKLVNCSLSREAIIAKQWQEYESR